MKKGLTQRQLAKLVNLHYDTLYSLENDKSNIHVRYILLLEQILECSICKYDPYYRFASQTSYNIKYLRHILELNKNAFAKLVNVSHTTIINWESEKSYISRKDFYKLKNVLKIT